MGSNIGRCLFLMGRTDEALLCYAKSFEILKAEKSEMNVLNRGYASMWIGEALASTDLGMAAAFYERAIEVWSDRIPQRADEALRALSSVSHLGDSRAAKRLTCEGFVKSRLAGGRRDEHSG